MSEYNPEPMDIKLSPEKEAFALRIAARIHDSWASERLAQGWKFGPERNDETKEHPCLIPFEQLTEYEKRFDIVTARTVIAAYEDLKSE